ncbi:MAG: 50S ribosomal protein L25/general stress protein Ctc [Chlamydiales bacterium]
MELTVSGRKKGKKSEISEIRRTGNIPAVLYAKGAQGKEVTVDGGEFKKILRNIEPGTLSSQIFELNVDGKKVKTIVKDVQYRITTYDILHLDFLELNDDVPVTLNIPIRCKGAVNCAGVKLGGVLRQVIRAVKVKTLPKNIPAQFEIEVQSMGLGAAKRLSEISFPQGVTPLANLKEIAVVIARK